MEVQSSSGCWTVKVGEDEKKRRRKSSEESRLLYRIDRWIVDGHYFITTAYTVIVKDKLLLGSTK